MSIVKEKLGERPTVGSRYWIETDVHLVSHYWIYTTYKGLGKFQRTSLTALELEEETYLESDILDIMTELEASERLKGLFREC